ncbi:hypothetical protein D9757_007629 [Collybiopsis confluens]|uniref:Uncharacterized protein n=1 Tax=Collybiopsis confluens TaxID=2823264 RepID=A0A8H5H9T6_9AGAR|nr:hypothetical protein D9757_007629 [Collybiopsis confluens]
MFRRQPWWIGALEYGVMSAARASQEAIRGGSFALIQKFYSMAQASKAIILKDAGGPFGKRIESSWALRVGAYATSLMLRDTR